MPSPSGALADENALHAAFLTEYRALDEEARQDLGPAANLSQKVVEGAFVRAWDARMKLKTSEELHQFLVDDVHHAAARALSRRASAHRMGDHGHDAAHDAGHADAAALAASAAGARAPARPIDPDEAWAHIQQALHGEHSAKALTEAAEISRHDAAHHIAAAAKERSWKAAAFLGIVAVLASGALIMWLDRRNEDTALLRALQGKDTRVVNSVSGQVGIVTLDDGSRVRLAPDSRLSIPATFGDRVRGVALDGAAAFEVAKGQSLPFRVSTSDAVIVATGTSFAVRAYAADSATTVVVTSGEVEVHHADQTPTLATGGTMYLHSGAEARAATPTEREAAAGWVNGTLSIVDRPLRDVLPQLRRWYGMNVTVPDPAMLDRRVTVLASLDSSGQVIRGIEKSTGLEFAYEGRAMVFRAPAAAKRRK